MIAQWTIAQFDMGDACKDLSRISEMEQQSFNKRMEARANKLTGNYDLKYHRMEWTVDPAVSYIAGRITTYFTAKDEGLSQLNFDFTDNMQVNAVLYHGDSHGYLFTTGDNLQIELPVSLDPGQLDSITIDYEGTPLSENFGSFEASTHNGVPVLWTLSEPYGAKTWWPCKQDLTDKIDSIDVYVRTPAEYRAASNGVLADERLDGDEMVYHWHHRYPIPAYLVAIAVTNYAVFSDYVQLSNGDSLEILNYVYPENLSNAQAQLKSTVEIMQLFNDLFGDYPFSREKYGHAQFGWGGGMEHQTMSFMGGFSYGLVAHELAHQWFGDKVTCGSWADIWLNEGFATYLTGLTDEFLKPEGSFTTWKYYYVRSITREPGGSVWVDDTTSVNRIFNGRLSYNKGAMVLHMLRWKLGDDAFFRAVRNYIDAPELAFHYAYTADLQYYLEQEANERLDGFFDDWYYGQGYPSYQLGYFADDRGIQILLNQTQSHPSVDFFELPVPVKLIGGGRDTLVRLEHLYNGQTFEIDLPFLVDSVVIDPEYNLISAKNTVEVLTVGTDRYSALDRALTIQPNPFDEELTVRLSDPQIPIDRIVVYNAAGMVFRVYDVPGQVMTIGTGDWPEGIYFVVVQTSGQVLRGRKLVK